MGRSGSFFIIIALLIASSLVSGCASGSKSGPPPAPSIVKECVLPEDQQNSLQGKWTTPPIKLSFKAGDWNSEEVDAILKAADTWNKFFNESKGITLFDVGPAGGNQVSIGQTAPACGGTTITEGTVIYKRAANWTKAPSAVALTTLCQNAGSDGLSNIYNAIMEFNYQNFFVASANQYPDLESIALHEFGHLLGLDHSCGPLSQNKNGLPNVACPDTSAPDHFLFKTIMFPEVFFDSSGGGEIKRKLDDNDQGRANCLYN